MNNDKIGLFLEVVEGAINFLGHLHPQYNQALPSYKDIQAETLKLLQFDMRIIERDAEDYRKIGRSLRECRRKYETLLLYPPHEVPHDRETIFEPYFLPVEAIRNRRDFQSMTTQEQTFWMCQAIILEQSVWECINWVDNVTSEKPSYPIKTRQGRTSEDALRVVDFSKIRRFNDKDLKVTPLPLKELYYFFLNEDIISENYDYQYFIDCILHAYYKNFYEESKHQTKLLHVVFHICDKWIKPKDDYREQAAASMKINKSDIKSGNVGEKFKMKLKERFNF